MEHAVNVAGMAGRSILLAVRSLTVFLLAILAPIVLVSGILLATAPHGPHSGEAVALGLSKELWESIHVYASFAAAGVIVVHVYVNYRGILYHAKRIALGLGR